MIRVLVVDDDRLVRKGLISAMPWQDFGMQVVGEANNGAKALEFLETHDVDLMLTDLAMPVMSGIELMRIARERFPQLHVVILTLHQDFEYIQEALRLGAIDYIAKVQLEKEKFEEVLERILKRIDDQTKKELINRKDNLESIGVDYGYGLVSLDRVSDNCLDGDWQLPAEESMLEVDRNSRLWFSEEGEDSKLFAVLSRVVESLPNSILLLLSDIKELSVNETRRWIRDFTERELFYEYHPDNQIMSVCIHRSYEQQPESDEERLDELKVLWMSAEWLHDDLLFNKLVREIKLRRLPQVRLIGLLYSFVNEWNRLFSQTRLGKISLQEPIHSWYQIEIWLEDVRNLIRVEAGKTTYSHEIINCMLKAVQIMQAEMNLPLTAAEVAKRLNMSRSYFSLCFKDILGNTFNEHIRMIRMEKAKEYLLCTNKTILWIAEHTGYLDEKYFSRTFRDRVGMLPSEYRLSKRVD
jgi:two-component system, response regulator YesN